MSKRSIWAEVRPLILRCPASKVETDRKCDARLSKSGDGWYDSGKRNVRKMERNREGGGQKRKKDRRLGGKEVVGGHVLYKRRRWPRIPTAARYSYFQEMYMCNVNGRSRHSTNGSTFSIPS